MKLPARAPLSSTVALGCMHQPHTKLYILYQMTFVIGSLDDDKRIELTDKGWSQDLDFSWNRVNHMIIWCKWFIRYLNVERERTAKGCGCRNVFSWLKRTNEGIYPWDAGSQELGLLTLSRVNDVSDVLRHAHARQPAFQSVCYALYNLKTCSETCSRTIHNSFIAVLQK